MKPLVNDWFGRLQVDLSTFTILHSLVKPITRLTVSGGQSASIRAVPRSASGEAAPSGEETSGWKEGAGGADPAGRTGA